MKDNQCVCKEGFQFDSTKTCTEICGDGLLSILQCDDGNQQNGDGCSSQCIIEDGFQCDSSILPTNCKSKIYLNFELVQIIKNEDNSAIMTFKVSSNFLPFPL